MIFYIEGKNHFFRFSLKYGLDECNCSEHSVQRIWFSDESVLQSVFELQKAFYFLQYECDFGYEFLDDAKLLYCRKGKWEPETLPRCVGKGSGILYLLFYYSGSLFNELELSQKLSTIFKLLYSLLYIV